MTVLTETDQTYWRGVLDEGGSTTIPRWCQDPGGVAIGELWVPVPDDLLETLGRIADGLVVPLSSVVLAAHARVLSALAGESDVGTGYQPAGGRSLPCRLSTEPTSWRGLVLASHRVERDLLNHASFPLESLRRELGRSGPEFETVFAPLGRAAELEEGVVLRVTLSLQEGHPGLLLRYRTGVLDGAAADRTGGYYRRALELMAADPDAAHGRQSLLSEDELAFQLHGLAGRPRELPSRRLHELFEEQARIRPNAVAAVRGDQAWTYREVDDRANQLSRALLARGLGREDVVAVVAERTLDWLAAVLAVFKAGGVYLPIEPHFPPARILSMLSRAGCQLVLAEDGSTTTLDEALGSLPDVQRLTFEKAYAEPHPPGSPEVVVTSDQLAYLYFTSGSTGEPKGALCEHQGMLNHVLAKIEDLEIGAGTVVAQTAPQCFDISLWQLVAALLVGGRTLLVEQEAILDVEQFVDTVVQGRVGVLQVVPSYLEVVLSYLEQHPRALPHLAYVSVTGEAVKKELVQRWFSGQPGTRLVNAYGLTETSDDTNHEVMDRAPEGDRVPLGRPLPNVAVSVVDDHLSPVPLGAPGAIVFSGVCVGRGYINDPERTREAFLTDPHRPGQRLYRAGDFGRWLPDGKLEFLGRRDHQVKISGFRIEIGDIENALLRVPGVGDGAVVVAQRAGQTKQLVAFYSGPRALEDEELRDRLAAALPPYLVPAVYRWHRRLPLTANSKIDRLALTGFAEADDVAPLHADVPQTPTEQRLASAWAGVLGVPVEQVSRRDHFFERGGTSLSAVKLAITLKRAVSLKDLLRFPVLVDLAAFVDGRSEQRADLLQLLQEPIGKPRGVLICFPHAGGNAVSFRPLAQALVGSDLAVYAVELPGHDLAVRAEPFQPLSEVVGRLAAEVVSARLGPVLLWGHSSGAAFALAAARALGECGVDVGRVFFAAQLPGNAPDRRRAVAQLGSRSSSEIGEALAADGGYTELAQLDPSRAAQAGAAYRHDCISAHSYLAELLDNPPAVRLAVPVTVVVAADDASTADARSQYDDLAQLAEQVDLQEVVDGGHFFVRTRPEEAASAVLVGAGLLAPHTHSRSET